MIPYVKNREYVISEFLNNVRIEYGKDRELIDLAIDLTVALQVAPCDNISDKFVNDLRGFMVYCELHNHKRDEVLTTVYHDLKEFSKNRTESWFSPRSEGYSRFLS